MKIFEAFKLSKKLAEKTKYVRIYRCTCDRKEYNIILTRRFADKRSVIHCINDYVAWEQLPRMPVLSGLNGEKVPVYKFSDNKNAVTVFVVRGKPNVITGLDEGIFRGANNFDDRYINVMSYGRFKKI